LPSNVISVAINKSEEPSLQVIDQISYLKEQSDDDEDLCQIDKVTTEQSRSRSRQRRKSKIDDAQGDQHVYTSADLLIPLGL